MTNDFDLIEFLNCELSTIQSAHESFWIRDWIAAKNLSSADSRSLAAEVVRRRQNYEPLAYIFGEWTFCDLELYCGPGVLIPRPETEELVDLVLQKLSSAEKSSLVLADFGAGTGALGIAIARKFAQKTCAVQADLIEKSTDAFRYLERNVARHKTAGIFFRTVHSSWDNWAINAETSSLDLLVSNPPYVSAEEFKRLDSSVRGFEPRMALVPDSSNDAQALSDYQMIIGLAKRLLKPNAWLFFEMGLQAEACLAMLNSDASFKNAEIHQDICKKPRFISAQRSSNPSR